MSDVAPPEDVRHLLTSRFPLVDNHPDVAGLLRDPELLSMLGPALAAPFSGAGVTKVFAPEARGPIIGALVARELGAGLVLARKDQRNHPGADETIRSGPTWRGRPEVFQSRSFDFDVADTVLLVDDWVSTGNSLRALRTLVERAGARYLGAAAIVNKAADDTIDELAVHWLARFDDLVTPPFS
jgi:adenine phosphoribosyltransferase